MPKKILYIHHATGLGGAPRSLGFLIAGLNRDEFEPIVVMPKREGNDAVKRIFVESGAEVIEETDIRPFHGSTVAPCLDWKQRAYAVLSYNRLVASAKRVVSELKPDIVHLNSTCVVGAGKGAHLADPNVPVIAHVREPLLQNWWGRMLARMNRRYVDWFVAIDQFGMDSIGLQQTRGDVVYNFVDREKFKPDSEVAASKRQSIGWRDDQVVFLSLSRVAKSNGALELAELVKQCESELDPTALFVVAGFDESSTGYAQSARQVLEASDRCQTMPFTNDVIAVIDAAQIIIAPFTSAHSARSVFEGAAMGKPALVTNLPNLKELIVEKETGMVFELADRQSFIDSVNLLCDPNTRESMGHAAFDLAAERFDSNRNIEKTMQIYRNLLGSGD